MSETNKTLSNSRICYDHLGNKFRSFRAMCRYYNINHQSVQYRLSIGQSLEEALTAEKTTANAKICYDHLGNKFESFSAMCRYYNTPYQRVQHRLSVGQSLKEALTAEKNASSNSKICYDFQGNKFKSQNEMCEYYGITRRMLKSRLLKGLTLEEALTLPKQNDTSRHQYHDMFGNHFDSLNKLLKCYNIYDKTYRAQKSRNYSLSQILGVVPKPSSLERIANSDYYLVQTDTHGEVVMSFEQLEKYYISKFDQSKLKTEYMLKE